jgi:hypothetical protein
MDQEDTAFGKWLIYKYGEWVLNQTALDRKEYRSDLTKNSFCEYLKISKSTFTHLAYHGKKPEHQILFALVEIYGEEVYRALGEEPPPHDLEEVKNHWDKLNLVTKGKIIELIRDDLSKKYKIS